ncbi:MAG TPA: diphthine--ammonia ligase [Candidatus Bathyarchaeia archaeon]|nr:diphthine--ammonia ligase [Candidatus Bathyarchaeia archaeon]
MRVGVLFSGGKDSTYAAWLASKKDELACLVTLFPKSDMSFMFHYPDLEWTSLQAEAIGVPQLTWSTEGVKEEELTDLERSLASAKSGFGLQGIYTGALASVYQKTRVERVCENLGLECLSPLWRVDPEAHLRRLVKDGFVPMVVSVSALGLDQSWLGRILDGEAVDELVVLGAKFKFNVGLEGGEGETFVLDCPLFTKMVEVQESTKHWRGDSGYLQISKARLVPKA